MAEKSLQEHYLHSLEADNERLEAENKRLREALEGARSAVKNNLTDVAIEIIEQSLEGGGEC